jgi:hypothetical protein
VTAKLPRKEKAIGNRGFLNQSESVTSGDRYGSGLIAL